jgi:hypothetical protein
MTIYVLIVDDRDYDSVAEIAFQAGKDACGLVSYSDGCSSCYVHGKFSDYVRVRSALMHNGYKILEVKQYESGT